MQQKCVACQHYDRNEADSDDKNVRWGKCRRTGPIVHPLSAKAYMVEGVWPHVRDDDWCGEWALSARRPDSPATQAMSALMMPSTASIAHGATPAYVTSEPDTDVLAAPVSTLMRGQLGTSD